jgi:hypothetical protein
MIHVYLAKESVCDCGFPLLKDGIHAGPETDYYASPENSKKVIFRCGGCGKEQILNCWFIHQKGNSRGGYLPSSVFKPLDDAKEVQNKS